MSEIKIDRIVSIRLSTDAIAEVRRTQKLHVMHPFKFIPVTDLHVTLWKLSKEERQVLGKESLHGDVPNIMPVGPVIMVKRPEREIGGQFFVKRTSLIMLVDHQRELRQIVDEIAASKNIDVSDYELQRPFHISIANLTGSPFDSIGDITRKELKIPPCDLCDNPAVDVINAPDDQADPPSPRCAFHVKM